MRSIVYESLFVACWFATIGAFRSSLLFRLLDVVPSQVRFVVGWLLCFLIVGIQASGNFDSIISPDVIRMKSYMDTFSLFDPTCVPMRVTFNKLNFFPNRKIPRFASVLRNCGGVGYEQAVYLCRVFLSCLASLSLFPWCILCRTHMEFYRRHRLV